MKILMNSLIQENTISLIGIGILLLLIIVLGIVRKKFPFGTVICLIVLSIAVAYDIFYGFPVIDGPPASGVASIPIDIIKIIIIVEALFFVILLCLIFIKKRKKTNNSPTEKPVESLKETSYTSQVVYFIADKNGKIIIPTDNFYGIFKTIQPKKNKYLKAINEVYVDHKKINKNNIFKEINKPQDEIKLELVLTNEKRVEIDLARIPQSDKNKINSYIYMNRKEEINETVKKAAMNDVKAKLYTYLCMLDTPIAYYDPSKNKYICTNKLMELFNKTTSEVDEGEYRDRIFADDLSVYNNRCYSQSLNSYYYRLRTSNGFLWFEEKTLEIDGQNFVIVTYKENNPNYTIKSSSYVEMITDIQRCYNSGSLFAIALLSFANIPALNAKSGVSNTDIYITKYFEKLSKIFNAHVLKAYRFGEIEYGLIFKDFEEYNFVLRSLHNGTSELLGLDVYVGEVRYSLKNKVGIAESRTMAHASPEELIKGALNALDVASDKEYANDYCIYYPPKPRKVAFNLIDYGIDISNNYLDEIYHDDDQK